MTDTYATVYILDAPYHAEGPYTYFVPPAFAESLSCGSFVTVPFGGGNRKRAAVVTALADSCEFDRTKPILAVSNASTPLSGEQLGLCFFLKEQTLCTMGDAVRTVIPFGARQTESFVLCPDADLSSLSDACRYVCDFIASKKKVSSAVLRREFGEDVSELMRTLVASGAVRRELEVSESVGEKVVAQAILAVSREDAEAALSATGKGAMRSAPQRAMLAILMEENALDADSLRARCGGTAAHLAALVRRGLVRTEKRTVRRNPFAQSGTPQAPTALSAAQQRAFDTIDALYSTGEPRAALLHGVTGSGKTHVIRAMIDRVLRDGRTVIVLVPEISLTPQTVSIFCGYYGDRVAVVHSGLSAGERADAYRRAESGEADIVIGTRSAGFAPLRNLGMIVIDEEQEHTYKSESSPKYTAVDVARYRCAKNNALMLLSSATPSLGSYYKAENGTYTLVPLTERYGKAVLPRVAIADMRKETLKGNLSPLGEVLMQHLSDAARADEKSILFLNRRGYNNFLTCKSCGETIRCPNCSVSLTYHTRRLFGDGELGAAENENVLRAQNGTLSCHYCGYRAPIPTVCPACKKPHLSYMGFGTQLVEEELSHKLPAVPVVRMDTDTTKKKFAHKDLLDTFRRGGASVLLGTQMVTKGHDFPDVTVVGVLLADASLYLDDFRAAERTFSMLTQVIGRAGRADKPGVAVVQTLNPDSEVLRLAAAQDYAAFYKREIALRRALTFPPFCDIVLVTLSCDDEATLSAAAASSLEFLKSQLEDSFAGVEMILFGPFEAPIYKVQGQYRMRIVAKCRLNRKSRALFGALLTHAGQASRRVSLSVDFNPSSL